LDASENGSDEAHWWSEARFFGNTSQRELAKNVVEALLCKDRVSSYYLDGFAIESVGVEMMNLCHLVQTGRLAPTTGDNSSPLVPCSREYAALRNLIAPIQRKFNVDIVSSALSGCRWDDGLSAMCDELFQNRSSSSLPTTPCHGDRKVYFNIAGSVDGVVEARHVLEHLFANGWHELTHPGLTLKLVEVPDWACDEVSQFALSGAEVRHVQKQWGVAVQPPLADRPHSAYAVVGPEPAVRRASAYMERLVEAACDNLLLRQRSGGDIAMWWDAAGRSSGGVVQDQLWRAIPLAAKAASALARVPPRRSRAFDAEQAASARMKRQARQERRQQQKQRTRARDQDSALKSSRGDVR